MMLAIRAVSPTLPAGHALGGADDAGAGEGFDCFKVIAGIVRPADRACGFSFGEEFGKRWKNHRRRLHVDKIAQAEIQTHECQAGLVTARHGFGEIDETETGELRRRLQRLHRGLERGVVPDRLRVGRRD